MPKAVLNIPAFAGGEISKVDPRDIPDEALSKAQDVMMDKIGLVRLMGSTEPVLIDNNTEALHANITAGYGLYTFRADKHIKLSGQILSTETYTFKGTAYTRCNCEQNHKFTTGIPGSGAKIYIKGGTLNTAQKTALFKRHEIIHVIDSTSFVIDLAWSDLGVDSGTVDWIWNPGWGGRPYLDIEGNYVDNIDETYDSTLTDWSYCSLTSNPKDSDPIDGEYIYIAIQNDNAINLYHYNYDVLLSDVLTLTNAGEPDDIINNNNVKPNMIYVDGQLKVSEGNINSNKGNSKPKVFGYYPPRKFFKRLENITDITDSVKIGLEKEGRWNVYGGTKDIVPNSNSSNTAAENFGYLESSLEMPKISGTVADYSTSQFQVSQYNTRNGSDANLYGGLSSLLDGRHDVSEQGWGSNPPLLGNEPDPTGYALNSQIAGDSGIGSKRDVYPPFEKQIHMVVSPDTQTTGDWDGLEEHSKLGFGMSWVYGTKNQYQESKIAKNNFVRIQASNSPENTSGSYNPFTAAMSFRFEFFLKFAADWWSGGEYQSAWTDAKKGSAGASGDPRLIGASIYVTEDSDGDIDDPLYLGTIYFDYREGFIDSYGNKFPWKPAWLQCNQHAYIGTNGGVGDTHYGGDQWAANNGTYWVDPSSITDDNDAIGCALRRVPTLTYKLRNYGLEPYDKDYGFQARWKTSVFAQNRLFVGGVQLLDGPTAEKNRVYPDRMLISPEVKYDLFPHDTYIDLQTNDGDSIVKLEYYKGKLLQFKTNVLYIIDLSGEFYFTEATHMYIGIKNPWSSAKTPGGIAWVNNNGLYIYDGSKIVNLIEKKIDAEAWDEFCGGSDGETSPMITFIPRHKQLLICRSPEIGTDTGNSGDVYIYDVETESFTFGKHRIPNVIKSNFSINFNDKSLIGIGSLSASEQPIVVTTTAHVFPGYSKGAFLFTGANATGNVTFQYYKGGNSGGSGGTWTNFTDAMKLSSNWNNSTHSAQNLAAYILRVAQTDNGWFGDLKLTNVYADTAVCIVEVEALTKGTAYNTGAGDASGTGYNSFRLNGSGTEWTTTTDNDGTEPDIGTTNGATGWVTDSHMSGGSSGTPQVDTVTIDRNSSTLSNIRYVLNLKIYQDPREGGSAILYDYTVVYFTDSGDNSDNNLAISIANILKGDGDLKEETDLDPNSAALDYIDVNTPSSGSFTITSKSSDYRFQFSLTTDSAISLKQFKSDSKFSRNIDIQTKEYDFNEPNVRKKIYKLYLTYKSNDESVGGSDLSNVRVFYAINGSSTFHAMKLKGSAQTAGYPDNLPSSSEFTQAELVPNPASTANKPNKVYSIKFRICSRQSATSDLYDKVDGFELNDMSIIYRLKSVK